MDGYLIAHSSTPNGVFYPGVAIFDAAYNSAGRSHAYQDSAPSSFDMVAVRVQQ